MRSELNPEAEEEIKKLEKLCKNLGISPVTSNKIFLHVNKILRIMAQDIADEVQKWSCEDLKKQQQEQAEEKKAKKGIWKQ